MCKHCGQPVVNSAHTLWECPQVNKHRKITDLECLNQTRLHPAISNGIPPAMTHNHRAPYWGKCDNNDAIYHATEEEKKQLGILYGTRYVNKADSKDCILKEICYNKGICADGLNARQTFRAIKYDINEDSNVIPEPCNEPAPPDINVYTDGSWLNPLKQYLGLGGAGVWWPKRLTEHHPISSAEDEIAYAIPMDGGVRLYTKIGGYNGSSTRAELGAAIVAITANEPTHIGSDSKVFVDKANDILSCISNKKEWAKPWNLESDGDLWEQFYKAVLAKGHQAIKITKVKGHATAEHIKQGISNATDKDGNDKADLAADAGVLVYGQDLVNAAAALSYRWDKYLKLMKKISHHLIEGYLIHHTLLDKYEEEKVIADKGKDLTRPYSALQYPKNDDCVAIQATSSMTCYKGITTRNPNIKHAETFINDLKVNNHTSMRHITWIELYILYRLRGHAKPLSDSNVKALSKASLDKQLKKFQNNIKASAARILIGSTQATLFKAGRPANNNLIGTALLGKHATIATNVAISQEEEEHIAIKLTQLGRNISNNKAKLYINHKINLEPTVFKVTGKVWWDSTIHPLYVQRKPADGDDQLLICASVPPAMLMTFLQCPRCSKVESSFCKSFQREDLDKHSKCQECKHMSANKLWKCPCNLLWHTCQRHWNCTLEPCRSTPQSQSAPSSKRYKKAKPLDYRASYEDMLDEDKHKANLKRKRASHAGTRWIHLGSGRWTRSNLPLSLIGPSLVKRFKGGSLRKSERRSSSAGR